MHASRSAIDSAFPAPQPRVLAADPCDVAKRALRVVILDIAQPELDRARIFDPLEEKRETVRVWLLTILCEGQDQERKERPIQRESEIRPSKIRRRFEGTKGIWVRAVILALLAGCCAVTFFFAFQLPFRLRANGNQANTGLFRSEIAAQPVSLGAEMMSGFRGYGSRRSEGDNREVVSGSSNDSGLKRTLPCEHSAQRKRPRVRIQSAEFSRRD